MESTSYAHRTPVYVYRPVLVVRQPSAQSCDDDDDSDDDEHTLPMHRHCRRCNTCAGEGVLSRAPPPYCKLLLITITIIACMTAAISWVGGSVAVHTPIAPAATAYQRTVYAPANTYYETRKQPPPPAAMVNRQRDTPYIGTSVTQACARHAQRMSRRAQRLEISPGGTPRLGQLFCRTGYHLQVHTNEVNGTRSDMSPFGVLELVAVAMGLVTIRGQAVDRYVCMNNKGHLYPSLYANSTECVFMEKMLENYYNTYASCAHATNKQRKWYLSIRKNGRARIGRKTRRKQRATHFLLIGLDEAEWQRRSSLARGGSNDVSVHRQLAISGGQQAPTPVRLASYQLWNTLLAPPAPRALVATTTVAPVRRLEPPQTTPATVSERDKLHRLRMLERQRKRQHERDQYRLQMQRNTNSSSSGSQQQLVVTPRLAVAVQQRPPNNRVVGSDLAHTLGAQQNPRPAAFAVKAYYDSDRRSQSPSASQSSRVTNQHQNTRA